MCTVSAVGDSWRETFPQRWPNVPMPYYGGGSGTFPPSQTPHQFQPMQDALRECAVCGYDRQHGLHALWEGHRGFTPEISKEDFDALKAEVQELKALLIAAKRFDEATGQPDCEMDEKIELIRQVAELVGVDVDEVFGSQ